MKKKIIWVICTMSIMSILLTGCCLSHEWQEATCITPKICAKCEEIDGEALGHEWQGATCTEAKTCSVCGETEGEALGHTVTGEATCTEPAICEICGETVIEALGHDWQEATCLVPKTCSVCGETEGDIGDHVWVDATCLMPKTCNICGETEGEIVSHNFNESGICTMCGVSKEIELTMDNVDEFLTVTFTREAERDDFWTDGAHVTTSITVEPVSDDYIFENVQVSFGQEYYSNYFKTMRFEPIDFNRFKDLDSNGNLVYTFGPIWDSGYYKTDYSSFNFRIYEVRGTCIIK